MAKIVIDYGWHSFYFVLGNVKKAKGPRAMSSHPTALPKPKKSPLGREGIDPVVTSRMVVIYVTSYDKWSMILTFCHLQMLTPHDTVCSIIMCVCWSYVLHTRTLQYYFSHIFSREVYWCAYESYDCDAFHPFNSKNPYSLLCLNVTFPGSLAAQQVTFSIAEVGVKIVASYVDMHGTGAAFPCHKQAGVQVSFQHDPCGHVDDQVVVFFEMWFADPCDLWKHSKLVAFQKGYSSCPGTIKHHLSTHEAHIRLSDARFLTSSDSSIIWRERERESVHRRCVHSFFPKREITPVCQPEQTYTDVCQRCPSHVDTMSILAFESDGRWVQCWFSGLEAKACQDMPKQIKIVFFLVPCYLLQFKKMTQ